MDLNVLWWQYMCRETRLTLQNVQHLVDIKEIVFLRIDKNNYFTFGQFLNHKLSSKSFKRRKNFIFANLQHSPWIIQRQRALIPLLMTSVELQYFWALFDEYPRNYKSKVGHFTHTNQIQNRIFDHRWFLKAKMSRILTFLCTVQM